MNPAIKLVEKPATRPEQHQAIYEIPQADLYRLLLGQAGLDLPRGARIVAWWRELEWDDGVTTRSSIFIRVEHPSFRAVEDGKKYPTQKAVTA